MKKVYSLLAAMLLITSAASAQNLGNILGALGGSNGSGGILGTLSNVIYAATGATNTVNIVGTWTYTGSAINLGSDDVLSNVAGAAVSTTAQNKVDEYLAKIGVKYGTFVFTFNEDLTFTCTVLGIPVSGTWRTMSEDGQSVQLQFGKNLKWFTMNGTLKKTGENTCQMLFQGTIFLKWVKKILEYAAKQNATASTISSLAGNYNNMQVGMSLVKN